MEKNMSSVCLFTFVYHNVIITVSKHICLSMGEYISQKPDHGEVVTIVNTKTQVPN